MSLFSKFLLAIVVIVFAYALWPRDGSLHRWNPKSIADAEAAAWEDIRTGNMLKSSWNFYRVYDFDYRVSPVTALTMARENASAINSILRSTDPIDQEAKIPVFVEVATRLRGDVAQEFDPAVVGRSEYAVWVGVSDDADIDALTRLVASQMSALFGKPMSALEKAAGLRARALHAAFSPPENAVSWDKVQADLVGSWDELLKIVAPAAPAGD